MKFFIEFGDGLGGLSSIEFKLGSCWLKISDNISECTYSSIWVSNSVLGSVAGSSTNLSYWKASDNNVPIYSIPTNAKKWDSESIGSFCNLFIENSSLPSFRSSPLSSYPSWYITLAPYFLQLQIIIWYWLNLHTYIAKLEQSSSLLYFIHQQFP